MARKITQYPYSHTPMCEDEVSMTVENTVGLVVVVALLAYLIFALIKPEKF
ncbi:K(+)-transporting ATPase subunit F [Streptomyces sp. NPDC005248]|uniref:K(+)-transporting ATPase subunit F n=1 Tax=Streptomyces sp. NPDC005248 TaxID=3364709 RepID=UPI0036C62E3C